MAAWRWSTDPDGTVEVDTGDGNGFVAISLPPGGDRSTQRTESWAPLAARYAALDSVPLSWVLAVIYAESGGDPAAGSSDDLGAGLMQLTLRIYGLTRAQAEDPETSIRLGTQTLQGFRQKGFDLPAVASLYNAGGRSSGSPHVASADPWGYVETRPSLPYTGYIEKVVRASNYFLGRQMAGALPTQNLARLGGGFRARGRRRGRDRRVLPPSLPLARQVVDDALVIGPELGHSSAPVRLAHLGAGPEGIVVGPHDLGPLGRERVRKRRAPLLQDLHHVADDRLKRLELTRHALVAARPVEGKPVDRHHACSFAPEAGLLSIGVGAARLAHGRGGSVVHVHEGNRSGRLKWGLLRGSRIRLAACHEESVEKELDGARVVGEAEGFGGAVLAGHLEPVEERRDRRPRGPKALRARGVRLALVAALRDEHGLLKRPLGVHEGEGVWIVEADGVLELELREVRKERGRLDGAVFAVGRLGALARPRHEALELGQAHPKISHAMKAPTSPIATAASTSGVGPEAAVVQSMPWGTTMGYTGGA